jgi:hypothetical protein
MDINKIDKSKEYTFIEAWVSGLDGNVIITSKSSGDSYIIEKFSKEKNLKFYNSTITNWQKCTYILPDEIFDMWYITQIVN